MSSADIGTFAVAADAAEVAAFRRAAGLGEGRDGLPFTWPIRWMARPDIRAALTALVQEPNIVPFHEAQTFDYAAPLRADVAYTLAVTARRESTPDRLVAEGRLAADGVPVASVETVLRLFSTKAADAVA